MGILQVMVSLVTCKVVKYQAISIGLKKIGKTFESKFKNRSFHAWSKFGNPYIALSLSTK